MPIDEVIHYYCSDCGRDYGVIRSRAEHHTTICEDKKNRVDIGDRIYHLIKGREPKMKLFGSVISIASKEMITVTRSGQRFQQTKIERKQMGIAFFIDRDHALKAKADYLASDEYKRQYPKLAELFDDEDGEK